MSGENYPAGKMTVRGRTFEIYTNDDGKWLAYYDGSAIKVDSRELLNKALMRATKQAATKVSVPFIQVGFDWNRRIITKRGTATGIHSANRNVLVAWEDGSKEQLDRYGSTDILAADTDPAQWRQLVEAKQAAEQALAEFVKQHRLDLRETVQAELDQQMGDGE